MTEAENKIYQVGQYFIPSAPINDRALFSGRLEEVRTVINASTQSGQHVALFGERGVGKTSLANVLREFMPNTETITSVKVNCDADTNYTALFKDILTEIKIVRTIPGIGFEAEQKVVVESVDTFLKDDEILPNQLRRLFQRIGKKIIIIIDEFDRITDKQTKGLFADTIKNFSDYNVDTTFILVGVGDSIDSLIEEHQSVERALVQIKMPRMSGEELKDIIEKGLEKLEMTMTDETKNEIVTLSQGLPHYTHLLSLYTVQEALKHGKMEVQKDHLKTAIEESISKAQQTIRDAYYKAINSPRANLYPQVLLACALADKDELRRFSASDVKKPLLNITGKKYEVFAFSRHLKQFCDKKRGTVLEKIGYPRRFKYRFCNPLMEPFIIMHGKTQGFI